MPIYGYEYGNGHGDCDTTLRFWKSRTRHNYPNVSLDISQSMKLLLFAFLWIVRKLKRTRWNNGLGK